MYRERERERIQAKRIFRRDFDEAEYEPLFFLFFYLFIYFGFWPCLESWFRKQKKNMLPQRNKEGKKMEKKFDIFVEL